MVCVWCVVCAAVCVVVCVCVRCVVCAAVCAWWCAMCVVCVVQMIQSAPCLSRVVPKMHLIRVAEHLGESSRRPRHPRALDDEELFIIEGSPGRSTSGWTEREKTPVKRAKKPFSTATSHKVRKSDFLDDLQLWDLGCLRHDLRLWSLHDFHDRDIDHLSDVLQL